MGLAPVEAKTIRESQSVPVEWQRKHRPLLAGLYLGLAALSRSTALLTFPFFLLLPVELLFINRQRPALAWRPLLGKHLFPFFLVLGILIAGMLLYNQARFGSPLDFGYNTMNVNSLVRGNLLAYGQFNLHFTGTNFRYMLLEPPHILSHAPFLTFNPLGTGIFWTTPALLLAFLAFRHRERRRLAASLLAACLLPMALLLLYFNTGWYQFGYRFVLDFLPFALLLTTLGMRAKPGRVEKLLIVLSVTINIWGFLVFTFSHP